MTTTTIIIKSAKIERCYKGDGDVKDINCRFSRKTSTFRSITIMTEGNHPALLNNKQSLNFSPIGE